MEGYLTKLIVKKVTVKRSRLTDHTCILACFFHLAQSLIRNLAKMGLKIEYETNKAFAHAVRRFAALAFLPATEIVEGFLDITMCLDDCEENQCEN